jgi:hypothetical protein
MVYQPSKKELKQIENLNKGYQLIREGLQLIKANLPRKDRDVEMETFRMNKNFEKIIKRIYSILEKDYVDKSFIEIINNKNSTTKGNRLKKKKPEGRKKTTKKKTTKKKITKKRITKNKPKKR